MKIQLSLDVERDIQRAVKSLPIKVPQLGKRDHDTADFKSARPMQPQCVTYRRFLLRTLAWDDACSAAISSSVPILPAKLTRENHWTHTPCRGIAQLLERRAFEMHPRT